MEKETFQSLEEDLARYIGCYDNLCQNMAQTVTTRDRDRHTAMLEATKKERLIKRVLWIVFVVQAVAAFALGILMLMG